MASYTPQVTTPHVIYRAEIVDLDTVAIYASMNNQASGQVDLDGPNRGSTFGIRARDLAFGIHEPTSITPIGDGGLLIEIAGVQAGWVLKCSVGTPSLLSKEGFPSAGCLKKIVNA